MAVEAASRASQSTPVLGHLFAASCRSSGCTAGGRAGTCRADVAREIAVQQLGLYNRESVEEGV